MPSFSLPSIFTLLLIIVLIVIVGALFKSVVMVQQGSTVIVERLGKYSKTLAPGLHFLVPFIDSVRATIDTREQVVPFRPQTVITADNINVSIDTVIYYQITSPEAATYEIANPMLAIEQLAVTTMRNIIGKMDMEQAINGRDTINGQLRGELDDATGKWGIRVTRVELKEIDPPASVRAAMEQQMKAERDRRAQVLTADGLKQSAILTAQGNKQAAILEAEAAKQSAILRAEGEAQSAKLRAAGESSAILQVFDAIHKGNADPKLLSYEYIKMLPQIAKSESSKVWIVPTELTAALSAVSDGFTAPASPSQSSHEAGEAGEAGESAGVDPEVLEEIELPSVAQALAEAKESASVSEADAASPEIGLGAPADPYEQAGQAPIRPGEYDLMSFDAPEPSGSEAQEL